MSDETNEEIPDSTVSSAETGNVKSDSPTVRRSGRIRISKTNDIKDDANRGRRKKITRPSFKTAPKTPDKNKRTRASKDEEENPNPVASKQAPKRRKKRESFSGPSDAPKVELMGDDVRGHAIAEWYLLDIFEATRAITGILHEGTLITDCLVANMEETIIEIISKLLQRLSSVIITTLEREFDIKCNILPILKNVHENIKENVDKFSAIENENSIEDKFEHDEDTYEQALRCLDLKEPPSVIEEVISSPFDEDLMMIEHSYSRPSEQESEITTMKVKGKSHDTRQKFQCVFCSFKTLWKSKLRRHVKHHLHHKKRFECNVCDYSAATTEAYQKHVRTHTGEKPFACDLCNFRTANKSNLNRHKAVHIEEKAYACPHCPFKTRQRGSLRQHIDCHHNKSNSQKDVYACGDCSFITISRVEFNAHVKTHRTYECDFCGFVGANMKNLRRHQSKHKVGKIESQTSSKLESEEKSGEIR